jgi:hypothetical protein
MINNIDSIIKKTSFLIEKQKIVKEQSAKQWKNVLSFVKQKIDKKKSVDVCGDVDKDRKSLMNIYDLMSGLAEKITSSTQDDIIFLEEQLTGLQSLLKIDDKQKQRDLLKVFMGNDYQDDELFDVFKEKISNESLSSMKQLELTLTDIKHCIDEGSISDAEASLNMIVDEIKKQKEKQDCSNEDYIEGCHQCTSQSSCHNVDVCDQGKDLFSFVQEAEKQNNDHA